MSRRPEVPVSSAVPDENDTLCALIIKPHATPYQRLEAVVAIYGITVAIGCVVFVIFGTLDLKYPSREAFHELVDNQLTWVPNGLYIYVFVLVAYIGLLGFTYYCFGPKRKKAQQKQNKNGDGCPCCPNVYKGGEKAIIAFIVLGITIQLGLGFYVAIEAFLWYNDTTKTEEVAISGFLDGIKNYGTLEEGSSRISKIIDSVQKEYQCCGSVSAEDWVTMDKYINSVPNSCCKGDMGDNVTVACGLGMDKDIINTEGCWTFIEARVRSYLLDATLLAFIVTCMEMSVTFVFWIYLSCKWCRTRSVPTEEDAFDVDAGYVPARRDGDVSNANRGHHTLMLETDEEPNHKHLHHAKRKYRDQSEA